jgi:TonB-linked SusC/RagA family outer membrane protein
MRKTLLFLHLMLLLSAVAFSQSRIVTGQVKDENGSPVPYATIALRKNANSANTTAGVSSDAKGNFKIDVGNATSIVVTSAGFTAKEVGVPVGTNTISIQLGSAAEIINEVVVTALGIRREKRQLATATQTINADQINNSGTGNALSELNGKVSGLTVINSGGDPGGGTYMRLRGVTSITGNNQPLMVVDGVPIDNSINNYDATSSTPNVSGANSNLTGGVQPTNRGVDINPNDIESVTLLKGPAATALYGIQAASGALIITTKKGGGKGGTSISFNSSTTFDKVSQLPARQSIYSQGGDGVYQGPTDGSNRRLTWGARIDTLFRDGIPTVYDPNGSIVGASSPLKRTPATVYNPYDFFQTGLTFNNNIAVSGGTGKTGFRLSLGNVHQTGIIPNSKYDKTTLSLNGQTSITDRLSVSAGVNYVRSANDKVQQGSNTSSIMLGLLRTPTTFDNSYGLSNPVTNPNSYLLPSGKQRDYRGGAGYDNPYWTVNRNPFHENLNRVYGFGQANYQMFDWLSLTYRLGGDVYSQNSKNAYDIGSNAFPAGAIHLANYYNEQFNSDFTINLKKTFSKDFAGSLLVGHNYFTNTSRAGLAHGSGFVLPNFLDMSNANSYTSTESQGRKRTMAFYGEAHLDYKNQLFLTLTGRDETSSTLPAKNNSFFYPSASLAYEFTKIPGLSGGRVLTYGKLRVSAAQVGKDAPLQGLKTYFGPAIITDGFTPGIQFPINGNAGYQISSTTSVIGNPNLKAEKTNSFEVGTDLNFFQSRITLSATAYYSKSTDVILTVPIAYSTGFASELLNAATITNRGLEITLNTTPVTTKDFRWDLNFNWSRNINKVVSLAAGVPKVLIAGFQNGEVDAIAGQAFGSIYGSVYVRTDPNNMKSPLLINDAQGDGYGMPIVSTQNAAIGNVNPEWIGSAINNFTYKHITFGFQIDVRQGGDIWNGTRGAMSYFGTSKESGNRGTSTTFNGVLGHLDASGNIVHFAADGTTEVAKPGSQNNVSTVYNQYYWQNIGSSFVGPAEVSVEKASFVRFRQISLGYELPKTILQKSHFTNVSLTLFANNPFLWTKYTGVDPETSLAGPANGQGLDYFNNPGTKSYGVRLNVGL